MSGEQDKLIIGTLSQNDDSLRNDKAKELGISRQELDRLDLIERAKERISDENKNTIKTKKYQE